MSTAPSPAVPAVPDDIEPTDMASTTTTEPDAAAANPDAAGGPAATTDGPATGADDVTVDVVKTDDAKTDDASTVVEAKVDADEEDEKCTIKRGSSRQVNLCPSAGKDGKPDRHILSFNPVVTLLGALLLWGFVVAILVMSADDIEVTAFAKMKAWQSWVTAHFTWFYIGSQDIWYAQSCVSPQVCLTP